MNGSEEVKGSFVNCVEPIEVKVTALYVAGSAKYGDHHVITLIFALNSLSRRPTVKKILLSNQSNDDRRDHRHQAWQHETMFRAHPAADRREAARK